MNHINTNEALKKGTVTLTQPLEDIDVNNIKFEDLFNLNDIQQLQDEFAEATGVASIITHTDGTPITAPCNFCELCINIIRKTDRGLKNCFKSDAVIGQYHPEGPIVQQCLSSGLWDAGAGITVGGQHIANWLIGQVRDDAQSEKDIIKYAQEIEVDPQDFIKAFRKVPSMSRERFEKIAKMLFTLSNQLSAIAYKNMRQARFISERKQSEEQLNRLSTAIEQAHETIVITNVDATIQYVNPAFENITGYSSGEALGQNSSILQSGEHNENFYTEMWNTLTDGNPWQGHLVNRKKDGSIFHEDATISPVKETSGIIINYVAVKRDITNELQKEKQLQQSQKMESIGTLAGGIAHDFNNILGAIMGYTELSLDDVEDKPTTYQSLQQVLGAANRAKDLVSQILTFSRTTTINKVQIKTIPIVKEVCKFLRSSLPTTINIVQNIIAKHDLIMADPTQIHQILMNLCTNAGHAMLESGGELEVLLEEVSLNEDDLQIYTALKPGMHLKLTVKDMGYGISKDNLERIFDPYFTTKELGEGTGLGLAVVHGIVTDSGGDIKAYSEVGKGTVFHVLFPLIKNLGNTNPPIESETIPIGVESIMFVDDEETLVNLGKKILGRLGYKVTGFTSAEKALSMFKNSKESYDLIITDKTMPKMTGLDLAVEIKKVRADIPILLCTGFKDKDIDDKLQQAGITEYIIKPLNKREIAVAVREMLDKKTARNFI